MTLKETQSGESQPLKCPECRAVLKRRRTRNPDACEMVCGGCGKLFDICNTDTAKSLGDGA